MRTAKPVQKCQWHPPMTKLTRRQYAPLLHRSYAMSHSTLRQRSHSMFLRRYVQLRAAHYANASIRQNCPIRILPSPKLKATMKGKESVCTNNIEECCPRFNPGPWNDKIITWQDKRFVQDHVTSIFRIPLNFGAVMERNHRAIRAADACTDARIVLTDENSLVGVPRLQTSGGTWVAQRLLMEVAYFKATYWLLQPSR